MILPRDFIQRRDMSNSSYVWIILAAIAAFFVVLILVVNIVRRQRIRSATPPAYLPTNYLRNKWQTWRPQNTYAGVVNGQGNRAAPSPSTARTSSEVPTSSAHESRTEADFANNRLSVRSIMTLPPYSVAPLPSERLIAREGERAGVDTVVEHPESETEIEARREEEMDTLYNIRESRRREQREREERRQQRREARDRGDSARLEQLEAESRARARTRAESNASTTNEHSRRPSEANSLAPAVTSRSQQDSSLLIAELNSLREHNSRNRRVGSVSYAELGVARHDGSRIRADSIDSDHRPLLDSAASIGGRRSRSRATSRASTRDGSRSRSRAAPPSRDGHDRRPSTGGSVLTQDEDNRGDFLTPQSSGELELPPDPPSYEDDVNIHGGEFGEAPPYSSPILERSSHNFPTPPAPAHVAIPSNDVERAVSPRPSMDTMPRPSAEGFEPAPTEFGAPLRLYHTQQSTAPSIEVSTATPVNSVPPTPLEGRFPHA